MKNVSFYTMATVGGKNNKKYDIYYIMFILNMFLREIHIYLFCKKKGYSDNLYLS
jgi:hypothetical protein